VTDAKKFWRTETIAFCTATGWLEFPSKTGIAGVRQRLMALNLHVSNFEDIAIVFCRGRVVFGEDADELRRVILGLLKQTKSIVLNFAWVGQVDSSGLGTLVASFISARHHGARIKFAAPSSAARKVLRTTRVDGLFEIYDSTDDALKSFRLPPNVAAA
jgi:anti-sigma B factor antagonist